MVKQGLAGEDGPPFGALFDATPTPFLVVTPPDWTIVAANQTHLQVTGTTLEEQIGRKLFDVFPDDPRDPNADGVQKLGASLRRVVATRCPDVMAVQRYVVRDSDGRFVERWWKPVNTPVLGDDGDVAFIIHRVEEVTELVRLRGEADAREQLARDQQALIEQLRASEAALRAASERAETLAAQQAAILGQIDEGVIVTDKAGRITFVNEAATRIHGVARLDVAPEAYTETYQLLTLDGRPYPPHELPLARAVLRKETVVDERWRIRRPDGSVVLAMGSARPVLDPNGEQLGAVLTLRDDTEREAAERSLSENEARLRALTDNLPSGTVYQISTGPDGTERRFLFVSQSHEKLTGVPAEAVLADPTIPYQLIIPEDRPGLVAAETAALRDRKSFDVQARFRRADGVERWSRIISAPREQADGSLIWDGIQIDITDQKAAETVLRDLNGELERRVTERTEERDRLWRNTQDIQVVVDQQGVFRAVSPAVTAILGWRPEEMIGRAVFDFVVPDDRVATSGALERATQEALPTFENRYQHKDGGHRWISWVAAPEGNLVYASGRHITTEKEAAAALEAAQAQLRQAQKMEAVGQLTGGLAHDFNNLLAGISGSLELLQMRVAQGRHGEIDQYIAAAQGASRRAAALTHRLLAFSRRQTLDPKVTDVNRLIGGMEDLIRRTVGPTIEVEVVGAAGLWTTLVDPNQLENALLNLCINARDAMQDGGRLTVETANKWLDVQSGRERDLPPGQYLSLCVTDTGSGMTPEVTSRAFEPFYTTKPLGMGTGLGLSMVYGFARQSKGQVRIYSEVGQGTTMCIYLPRHSGEADEESAPPQPATPHTEQGRTVLVVDDEPTVRMLVSEVLKELGHTAIEMGDGPAGLEVLRSARPIDLLITDVGLPGGLNGRQVADAARALRPGLKVLFITGYAENAAIGNGYLEAGMQVLTKPFTIHELTKRIQQLVEAEQTS